jgi:hypothetical protein
MDRERSEEVVECFVWRVGLGAGWDFENMTAINNAKQMW